MNIHEMIDCLTKQIALRQDAIRALQAIDGPQFDWQPDNTPAPVGTKPKPNIKKASARRRQALREKFGNGAAHAGASTAGSFTHELLQVVAQRRVQPVHQRRYRAALSAALARHGQLDFAPPGQERRPEAGGERRAWAPQQIRVARCRAGFASRGRWWQTARSSGPGASRREDFDSRPGRAAARSGPGRS